MRLLLCLTIFATAAATRKGADGISFLVKSCEEPTLEESIESLHGLTIPHEMILIVHHCMGFNRTALQIAERIRARFPQVVKLFEYKERISRPGYETLATDMNSNYSLIRYNNWALRHAKHKWVAKWDADFIMTAPLRAWINAQGPKGLWSKSNQVIMLEAKNAQITETFPYFSSSVTHFIKNVFYEMPVQTIIQETHVQHSLVGTELYIYHKSNYHEIKKYMLVDPWFLTDKTQEGFHVRTRVERLSFTFGYEPRGFARSGNPAAAVLGQRILDAQPDYISPVY